jgi:hypothetical protein
MTLRSFKQLIFQKLTAFKDTVTQCMLMKKWTR